MPLQKSNANVIWKTKVSKISNKKKKEYATAKIATVCSVIQRTKVSKISNKKKKVSSDGKFKTYLKSWYKFCDTCTIGGLRLIAGYSKKLSIKNRITILLYFLTICGMMVFLCQNNMERYLLLKSKAKTTYNFRNNLTFPTVSFSNENRLQRSYVGGNNMLMMYLTLNVIISTDNMLSHFNYFMELNKKTCATNSTPGHDITLLNSNSYQNMIPIFMMNSSLSIIRCWWQELEIENCTNEFSSWASDDRFEISFNAQTDMYKLKEGFTPKTAVTSGPHSGLQLLMNLRQDEYCGVDTLPSGAGFRLMLYNPFYRQPSTELYPSISLGPGYSYEISIQPVTTSRQQLEWFGYCRTSFTNPFYAEVVYNRQTCFALCLYDKIYAECDCVAPFEPMTETTADYFHKPLSRLIPCVDTTFQRFDKIQCFGLQLNKYFRENPAFFCPQCKSSCLETLYSYQLTSTKLIPKKVNKLLNFPQNATDEDIRKNILQVKIYFSDLTEVNVIESLDFTSLDLFIFLGNNVVLFIGISTVSLFEIVYQIIYSFHVSILTPSRQWPFATCASLWTRHFSHLFLRRKNIKLKRQKIFNTMCHIVPQNKKFTTRRVCRIVANMLNKHY